MQYESMDFALHATYFLNLLKLLLNKLSDTCTFADAQRTDMLLSVKAPRTAL